MSEIITCNACVYNWRLSPLLTCWSASFINPVACQQDNFQCTPLLVTVPQQVLDISWSLEFGEIIEVLLDSAILQAGASVEL